MTDVLGRPQPPLAAGELDTLLGFLDYHRATLAWKWADVDPGGMKRTVAVSAMTLGGLLKHLTYVEDDWFHRWIAGLDRPDPWENIDWSADQDWEWNSARDDTPQDLMAFWRRSVERSQRLIDDAIASGGLDRLGARQWPDGRSPSLRRILIHLIEEYARHNGHADLLREAIDSQTGE